MNIEERNTILHLNNFITAKDLINTENRTLLYGYDCDRVTFHTYIKDGEIVNVYYGGYHDYSVTKFVITDNREYIPNKRLYPECCDFEFCRLLAERGIFLPFTVFYEDREQKQYYGKTI